MFAIAAGAYGMQHGRRAYTPPKSSQEVSTESESETELEKQVTVDGIEITGMSRSEARSTILKNYPWAMTVAYEGDTYEVANLMEEKVNTLLDEIYNKEPREKYTLDTSGLEEAVKAQAAAAAAKWDKAAKNGSISQYDSATDTFLIEGEEPGMAIDQEKLAADIQNALRTKKFSSKIEAAGNVLQPEITADAAKEKYKTLASYTTKTTANPKRNTNIRLAAEALNGLIVQPGQEISFNETVGERTVAKGYEGAAAYNNGEVVEEIGGGVCQVSTTLYNAVLRAGLQISVRRSHTFEPSYVTPGQDATVSWGGPDFKFVNSSTTAVGIRASYASQVVQVSVYGIPVLEEGVTYSLESVKVADLDPPAPVYEEDQTLMPDQEVQKSAGSSGSRWEARLVIKKGDEVLSREIDHTSTYKGHAPVILRNTSGIVIPAESSGESASDPNGAGVETPAPTSEAVPAQGPGDVSAQPGQDSPQGPGWGEGSPGGVAQPVQEPLAPGTPGFPGEDVPGERTVEPFPN